MHVAHRSQGHREEPSTPSNFWLRPACRPPLGISLCPLSLSAPSVSLTGTFARLTLVLATAGSALAGTNAPAARPVTTNAPIIVTASRANRTTEEMPANVTVITADAIRDSGVQNVVSALETLGGVYFRRNSDNPGLATISMRGFGDSSHGRVLVLVDGLRLNTADQAPLDWLRVPVSTVERIEVLHGGQTALYGDYAVAGVINIITHQPSGQPATTVSATVGSDNTFAGHIGHTGSIGDTRYTADLDWRKSDGWRDNSGYDNTDVRATLAHDWTEGFATMLSAFYTYNGYDMPGARSRAEMAQNPRKTGTPLDNAITRTFGGSLGCTGLIDADSRVESTLSASHRAITSDMFSYIVWGGSPFTETTLDSFAFAPHYTLDSDLAGHRNRVLAGFDLGLEQLDKQGYADSTRMNWNESGSLDRAHAAAYLQNEFWLTRQLSLALGARGELSRYSSDIAINLPASDASSRADHTYRQTAFDAALVYRPVDQLKLFARIATLYRDPFVDEMAIIDRSFAPPGAPPMNVNLKPETGRQIETGASFALANEWTFDFSAYRLDMHNEIAWGTGKNENLDETRRYGTDTVLTWTRKEVGLVSAIYNYVDARFSRGGNEGRNIPLVPAHVLTLRGELELPCNFTALATGHAVSSQYSGGDNGNVSAKIPCYGTLDLGLRYHPQALAGFALSVGVDNVFDHIYANSGYYGYGWLPDSYYPAAGRTWKLTVTYRF